MGKRYHCTYCDKTMVASPSIVKTHNNGLFHQKLVQEHYQQFKDPETILQEESNKKPCTRFAKGECQFGSICRYSHYTQEQLNSFRAYVTAKYNKQSEATHPSIEDLYNKLQEARSAKQEASEDNTILYDSNGVTYVFPWTYNSALDGFTNLPPSILRFKVEDFEHAKITEWG